MSTPLTIPELNVIIADIKSDKRNAFARIEKTYSASILSFIVQKINNGKDAEDIFQETLIKIWVAIKQGECDPSKGFYTWCITIAHNLCIDHKRRTHTKKQSKKLLVPIDTQIMRISVAPDVFNRFTIIHLQKCINKLPSKLKDIVVVRFYYGYSYQQAQYLFFGGVPISTLKTRYFKAMKYLGGMIKKASL